MSDDEIWALNRGGHDPRKVYAAYAAAAAQRPADGDPRQDDQGLRDGGGRRGPEHHPPAEEDGRGGAARVPRPLRPRAHRRRGRSARTTSRRRTRRRCVPARAPRPRSAARCPRAARRPSRCRCRRSTPSRRQLEGTGEREISTTMAFVRILVDAGARQGDRPARRADRPRRVADLRHGGHVPPARDLQPGRPALRARGRRPARCSTARTRTARSSRRASTRPGAFSSWIAAATSYANHGVPMIPFYIYYSMFGFQRVGDLAWAAGDSARAAS